jgi:hypothetical protein
MSFFGVAINWLNGQRFSTFHFIRDNRLCAEGRRENCYWRNRGWGAKGNTPMRREHFARRLIPALVDSCTRSIPHLGAGTVFLSFCSNTSADYGFVEFGFSRARTRGKWVGINGMLKRAWMFASPVFVWLHRAQLAARFSRKIQSEREKSATYRNRRIIRQYVDAVVLYECAGTHNRELIRVTIYILLRHEGRRNFDSLSRY